MKHFLLKLGVIIGMAIGAAIGHFASGGSENWALAGLVAGALISFVLQIMWEEE